MLPEKCKKKTVERPSIKEKIILKGFIYFKSVSSVFSWLRIGSNGVILQTAISWYLLKRW
jgi:hypothetical protein